MPLSPTGKLVILATCAYFFSSRPAEAGDPNLKWRTLETEHFRIHFYQGEERAARGLAVRAERAHRLMAPLLGHAPSQPTHVVLTDEALLGAHYEIDIAGEQFAVTPHLRLG